MSSTISSSSLYSVTSTGNGGQGIAGLMSGMDTESMVEKMLSGTQSKIDTQNAKRQQTEWKQEIYRDVISSINTFKNGYFNTSYGASATKNLASVDFYNSMISKVQSGDALSIVSTNSSATAGNFSMAVKQLATQATLTSAQKVSGGPQITGKALDTETLTKQFSKNVTLQTNNGTEVKVDLNGVTDENGMVDAFNKAFSDAGVTGVTARVFEGKLRFTTEHPADFVTVSAMDSSALGLQMTGLTSASSSAITDANGNLSGNELQGTELDLTAGSSIELTLDGVKKTISLNNLQSSAGDGSITAQDLTTALDDQVKKAFGDYINVTLDAENKLNFNINIKDNNGNDEAGHELLITGADATKFGITPGTSSHISSASKLSELGLTGDRYSFTINGTEFSFTADDTVGTMMNKINNSDAGVTLSYSTISDTFTMKASSTGAKYGIELSQQEGDLLGGIFGAGAVNAADTAAGSLLTTRSMAGALADGYTTTTASLTMNVNGKDYTFSLAAKENDASYTKSEIETSFNSWLKTTFGENEGTANLSYQDGKLSINDGSVVKFAATKVDTDSATAVAEAQKTDLALAMGFNRTATSNIADKNTSISDIYQIDNATATLLQKEDGTAAATLGEIKKFDNGSDSGLAMSFSDGRMTLSGSGSIDLSGYSKLSEMFGSSSLTLGDGAANADAVAAGQDAVILVDGVETSRSSNVFELDGITMQLSKVSKTLEDGSYEQTVINTGRDVDSIVDAFKSFVSDYNTMIEKLNNYIDEDPEYRDYPPLTDAQREDMTESQIKLWEEKVKVGLVHNDSTISNFLGEMRTAMYTKPESSKLALYDIGIETMSYYNDTKSIGKLQIDEAALRSAIASDPESVRNLFTDANDGLAAKLTDVMKRTANESSGSPGTLVQLAGVKNSATEKNNTLYDQIQSIKDRISDLKDKYDREKTRYWKQFSTMETVMANYNSQSMAISQQFSL